MISALLCVLVFMAETLTFAPHPGMQEAVMRCPADVVVCGGQAGPGKSWIVRYDALRHFRCNGYRAVIFRDKYRQIVEPGGLWDKSREMFPYFGGKAYEADPKSWRFPSGATITFDYLDKNEYRTDWQGAELCYIGFDELQYISEDRFWFMFSRNRSTCGVRPCIRASCNPVPEDDLVGGWLRRLVDWYIDDNGYAIDERSGVVRWFARLDHDILWADTRDQLVTQTGIRSEDAKSFSFIHGRLEENAALTKSDPSYRANLSALQKIDRERLLHGNWNARASAGMFFQRGWFEVVDAPPADLREVRYWDRAATEHAPGTADRSSWTAGCRMGRAANGFFYVVDLQRFQGSAMTVESTVRNTASQDGRAVIVGIEQDPGQAGKAEAQYQIRNLAGFTAKINIAREAKGVRARPFSAQCEAGNVKIVRGAWNDAYLRELENFDGTTNCVADQVDASSGAFAMLTDPAYGPPQIFV